MDFETYSQSKQLEYGALADTVASILSAALAAHPTKFRLQLVQARAKSPHTLKKKLEDRGLVGTTTLETDIKDLAGCRLIFYSNSDLAGFMQTGIINDNFEIDWGRTKIHYPVPGKSGPNDLFISSNFVVSLKADRTGLAEYARFAGLACEVQVQTTLNHAWSEMVHDILYKKPKLAGFGGKLFEMIEQRFQRIMKTYLLPAGYEFQKALDDFERLMSGKQLFDRGALKALAECDDNDARVELLERFRDYTLPNYDDPVSVYPEIKESLVAAVKDARTTKQRMIETPAGSYPGADAAGVSEIACEILNQVRYVSIDLTFDTICELYPGAQSDEERKHLINLTKHLAQHNLDVWKQVGPMVQFELVRKVRDLPDDRKQELQPVVLSILDEALGTEVQGTTSTYNSITLHRGAVVPGQSLAALRSDALDVLMQLYRAASSDDERMRIKGALFAATELPYSAKYDKALLTCVLNDSARIVDFFREEVASGDGYELTQTIEHQFLWLRRRTIGILSSETDATVMAVAEHLSARILSFRDVADVNRTFVIYNTLVGFESVFPPMWENHEFDYAETEAYRKERIDELVADVNWRNADEWFAIIQRCARTESNDMATFPSFGQFLQKLARTKPAIMLEYIDRLDDRLAGFLGVMLSGLAESDRVGVVDDKIAQWLTEDRYLSQIAHYFQFAATLNATTLQKVIQAGTRLKNDDVVAQVLAVVFRRYKDGTPALIDEVILPGIAYFTERQDARWVNLAWFIKKEESFLSDVNDRQLEVLLHNLKFQPRIETHTEFVLAVLGNKHARRIVDFFDERLVRGANRDDDKSFQAIPYEFHELRKRFGAVADHVVDVVRRRFVSGDYMFQFTGGRFIAAAFPGFSDTLNKKLMSYISGGSREDIEFVIRVLSGYHCEPFVIEPCKEMVRRLSADDLLRENIEIILQSTGVLSGEFGLVEAYQQKREALVPWLSDADEKVRSFAQQYIASLDRQIAAEQRRSEEDLEMRKRRYEDPSDDAKGE
jgi:ppGpp synthetase/RelA/SpoT-type nucleotidyltranferase